MAFRDRLFATIRAARPVLEDPGVLVVGSEVPNLLEPGAAATLVVSQDPDIGVAVDRRAAVKRRLPERLLHFQPSPDEPSVWTPRSPGLLMTAGPADLDELDGAYRRLRPELQHTVRSGLTLLSLMEARTGMPDPRPRRAAVAALLRRLESGGEGRA
jgi:hypothetical protein